MKVWKAIFKISYLDKRLMCLVINFPKTRKECNVYLHYCSFRNNNFGYIKITWWMLVNKSVWSNNAATTQRKLFLFSKRIVTFYYSYKVIKIDDGFVEASFYYGRLPGVQFFSFYYEFHKAIKFQKFKKAQSKI